MVVTRRDALAAVVAGGLVVTGAAEDTPPERPPHIVEKADMKGRMVSGRPCTATGDWAAVVKSFFAKMPTYPDIRYRAFLRPPLPQETRADGPRHRLRNGQPSGY